MSDGLPRGGPGRAVFLDRDGTISRYVEYCRTPEELQLLPGAGPAIRRLNDAGLAVIVVTNQSAIGRGWLTVEMLEAIHAKLRRELQRAGAALEAIYVCPHRPEEGCDCRKPGTGLLVRAAREHGIELASSYMVGDRGLDIRTGRAAGGKTVLVRSGHAPEPDEAVVPDHEAMTLDEAVAWILEQEQTRGGRAAGEEPWVRIYEQLAEAMLVVRRTCDGLPVLGVSTLRPRHLLPSDQVELVQELVRHNGSHHGRATPLRLPSWSTMIRRWLRCALFACRDALALCWLRARCAGALKRLAREPAEVLLRTWQFRPPADDATGDFYFGALPQQLASRGVSSLVVCGDIRGGPQVAFARAVLRQRWARCVPEWLLVPLWAPLAVAAGQWTTAVSLRRLAAQNRDPRAAKVCAAACLGSLQTITQRNMMHYYAARTAVRRWRAKAFVTFYEGQPWEQPAWHGAKAADPGCVTVGYQHTVLLSHNFALTKPQDDGRPSAQPDVVLCSGPRTRALMTPGHPRSRLVDFGTFRPFPASAALRGPSPSRRVVLVMPETGIRREAVLLFEFAMQAARVLHDHAFIFRCHPIAPFDQLQPHLRWSVEEFPNVSVSSERSFEEDCHRASVVLYRGSSSVLYAVLHGLKPIYLHDARHEHGDPLFELEGWREPVGSVEEFAAVARRYAGASDADAVSQWQPAAAYVQSYAVPVTDRSLAAFLHAAGMSGVTP